MDKRSKEINESEKEKGKSKKYLAKVEEVNGQGERDAPGPRGAKDRDIVIAFASIKSFLGCGLASDSRPGFAPNLFKELIRCSYTTIVG